MAATPQWVAMAGQALACRCPRCGEGKLYSGYLKLVERCERCELPLAKSDSGDGPAVFLIFILGFTLVPPAIIISILTDMPLWLHTIIWSVLILGATLGMLQPAKALTLLLQYRHRPETFHDQA
jgi:uncharacterized protein (DUF983 family)